MIGERDIFTDCELKDVAMLIYRADPSIKLHGLGSGDVPVAALVHHHYEEAKR